MTVGPYREIHREEWLRMRAALWPGSSVSEADVWLTRPDAAVFLAQVPGPPALVGFVEARERDYADGCDTSPVAFLEGWFVEPGFRGRGVGTLLVRAVELWARERGCTELASDCLLENTNGQSAHLATGFEEVERSVKYRKSLAAGL